MTRDMLLWLLVVAAGLVALVAGFDVAVLLALGWPL